MPDKTLTCIDCNKLFAFTDKSQSIFAEKGYPDPKRCYDCRQGLKVIHPDRDIPLPPDRTLICRDCHQEFNFPGWEQRNYAEKNYQTPMRCSKCRQEHRVQEEQRKGE